VTSSTLVVLPLKHFVETVEEREFQIMATGDNDETRVVGSLDSLEELSGLLADLENDRGIQLSLDAPELPRLRSAGESIKRSSQASDVVIPEVTGRVGKAASHMPAVVYRDSFDVQTILNMTWSMMILALLLVASGVCNVYQYIRRPDRIVVDGGSGRVLAINDRNYGREDGVEFGADRLTQQDKIYISKEFAKAVWQVDPSHRARDMERALTMMVPDSAVKFARWMKEKGVLDQQKLESWQTLWTPMDVAVDKNDPYTVNIIGKQDITKVVSGATVTEAKQLRLTIKLVADNKGRADRNLRSGFLVASFELQELGVPVTKGSTEESRAGSAAPASRPAETTPATVLQKQ